MEEDLLQNLRSIQEGNPPVDYSYQWIWYIVAIIVIVAICYSIKRLMPLFEAYRRLGKIDLNEEAFIPLINYWLK